MIQPSMITASDLARRWGKSSKWVRENIIKPRALTVYEVGRRDPLVSLTDVRVIEARAKRPADSSARDRLLRILDAGSRRSVPRNQKGQYAGNHQDL